MTAVAAVRCAFPDHLHPQRDLAEMTARLCGSDAGRDALIGRLYANAGVESRHTVLPLHAYGALAGLGAINDLYIDHAMALGERAVRAALEAADTDPAEVDLLIATSVTGVAVPSLDARLISRLGLRPDVKRLPLFGLGCVAGAAGLARLHDYLLGWPGHTAVLLAVELCSLSLPLVRPATADLVASALFGDGAAALVARGGMVAAGPGPRVVASVSEVCPDSLDALGWRLGADGFRIVLSTGLSDIVAARLGACARGFLAAHGLRPEDVGAWICHPGGPHVIDAVQHCLDLPDHALAASRRSLAGVGNLSSASVLHILQETIAADRPAPGTHGLVVGLGPGVSIELILLRW
ncbi:type III polyketide synthase [Actinospica durhamensis]|uniref:Type III polyketide synthase n=1 Tax=Actinospica durhamensis TaxID=1508375 RepID=A0A941ERM0_9ACTN|nr:3-oxoacyl-[acyl-carrier-protein] synthase III C-terminal domain-containing protein [Actinospica durhamensis]MBR7832534.1 type III polyketide synthase [Actinospica durhamensis]